MCGEASPLEYQNIILHLPPYSLPPSSRGMNKAVTNIHEAFLRSSSLANAQKCSEPVGGGWPLPLSVGKEGEGGG